MSNLPSLRLLVKNRIISIIHFEKVIKFVIILL